MKRKYCYQVVFRSKRNLDWKAKAHIKKIENLRFAVLGVSDDFINTISLDSKCAYKFYTELWQFKIADQLSVK